MQTKTFLAAFATSTFLLGASGAYAACDKTEKVTAVWLPIMQTTAYYVALEEKLFEKACIEIVSTKKTISKNQANKNYPTRWKRRTRSSTR
jgi:NitT/TauT family transport system substrate-binding protein